ncbi:hypothetical protein Tco_1418139 [Tanacetum coccineum]
MYQNFYNSNSSGFDQFQPPQFPVIHQPPQEASAEILQARENLMNSIQTFLNKFNRISFRETPKVLLLAWEMFFEIKQACREKYHQPTDVQELLHKLLKDLQLISEELADYINTPNWNRHAFYDDDDDEEYTNANTPDLSTEEPDNSLNTSIVYSPKIDSFLEEFTGKLAPTSPIPPGIHEADDDDSFKDIDYVKASPPDSELVSLEEVEDDILRDKLSNIYLLIAKIESLNDNPTPSFLSFSNNSLPEFETFSHHTEETRSGSTTTHADNSLPEYDSIHFEIEPDKGELSRVVMETIFGDIDEIDAFLDIDVSTDLEDGYHDSEGDIIYLESLLINNTIPNLFPEVFFDHEPKCLKDEPNNLTSMVKVFDPEILEKILSPTYVRLSFEDRHYLSFTYVIQIFLSYFTYLVDSPSLLSCGSEDTIFDPRISAFHFSSLNLVDFSDFKDSRARCFVHHSLDLLILSMLILGIRYP